MTMRFDLALALPVLDRTPGVLRALLGGLPAEWTDTRDGADTWSPFDVVGHLIHGERTDWVPRTEIILNEGDSRAFPTFDRFAQFRESQGRTLAELLDIFAELRRANLEKVRSLRLTPADLDRCGLHPELGPVTLSQHLAAWVAHDLSHIRQIVRVMGRQYAEAVGPWTAYLPMLQPGSPG